MLNIFPVLLTLALFAGSQPGFAMGSKKMQVSELKGVTESQVAVGEGKASVLLRGKAAELVFRMMKLQQEEQRDTEALKLLGAENTSQWTVRGKQVTCSKVSNEKKKMDDYACAFDVNQSGVIAAGADAFDPHTFNLARTETGSRLFKKSAKASRSVASVAAPATYSKGLAYLVYDAPGNQRKSENALIVFRGESAKEIMTLLQSGQDSKEASWGEGRGRKGEEIACVGATGKEPERCAFVVTFRDGSITRSGNPLFQ